MAPSNGEERLRKRFVRWQRELRRNLGSHVALIVSWSAGALVFCGALLRDKSAQFGGAATVFFLIASFLFIVCLTIALVISWSRLADTRATLRILSARRRPEPNEIISLANASSRSRTFLVSSYHPPEERHSKEKTVSARRRNQHARRVRYPSHAGHAATFRHYSRRRNFRRRSSERRRLD